MLTIEPANLGGFIAFHGNKYLLTASHCESVRVFNLETDDIAWHIKIHSSAVVVQSLFNVRAPPFSSVKQARASPQLANLGHFLQRAI